VVKRTSEAEADPNSVVFMQAGKAYSTLRLVTEGLTPLALRLALLGGQPRRRLSPHEVLSCVIRMFPVPDGYRETDS
jgi:hypothetical protein